MRLHATRRSFMMSAGLTAVSATRVIGANDKIGLGIIGTGGRGTAHLRDLMRRQDNGEALEVKAFCDVYRKRLSRSEEICPEGTGYIDYKELLARDDIDAVVIATPPHWHGPMAIDACKAGKDVYVEKPMTHNFKQAKELWQTAEKTGQIVQAGSQTTSRDHWHQAHKVLASGVLGKLIMLRGSHHRNTPDNLWDYRIEPEAGPDQEGDNFLDWEKWLGPHMPQVPYEPERYFRYRNYWEYLNDGIAGALLYHNIAPLHIVMGGADAPWPFRVTGTGGRSLSSSADGPDIFTISADYSEGFQIELSSTILNEVHIPGMVLGHTGTINMVPHGVFERDVSEISVWPDRFYAADFRDRCEAAGLTGNWPADGLDMGRYGWSTGTRNPGDGRRTSGNIVPMLQIPTGQRPNHMQNFLDCIRTREQPVCNARVGYKIQTIISMSVMSYKAGRMMYFDKAKEEIIDGTPDKVNYA
jgi:predicted dehydrogenase